MKITDYAVYKDDKTDWTIDEVKLIAQSMGANITFNSLKHPDIKYVYMAQSGDVYNWYRQNIDDKTPISYTDYLKLITPTVDNIKIGSKVLIVDKWTPDCYANSSGAMDHYLNTVVTIIDKHGPAYFIEGSDSVITWRFHLPSFKCLVLPELPDTKPVTELSEPSTWALSNLAEQLYLQQSRHTGKSILIDSMTKFKDLLKQEKPMNFKALFGPKPSRRGKYLSLKIKNGKANVRSLIYQAYNTEIEDPRPYIQSLIADEIKRLKQTVAGLDLSTIQYGFDIKLATLINDTTDLQQKIYNDPDIELDYRDCTHIYTLLDELAILQTKQQAATDLGSVYVDPYLWIKPYLTAEVLNIPKAKTLFVSNKIHIYIKDGYIMFSGAKAGCTYKAIIKLDVASNTYYI